MASVCSLPSVLGVRATASAALPAASKARSSVSWRHGVAGARLPGTKLPTPARRGDLCVRAGKKDKRKGGGAKTGGAGGGGGGGAKTGGNQGHKSPGKVKEGSAYQTETRKIILSLGKVRKVTPNGKELIKNINLGMYLGAKIGILGANGAGKSTLMKILAGVDKDFDGEIHLDDGIKVGYLPQEPPLDDGETVMSNIEVGVAAVKADLDEYNNISMQMAEPDCDMDKLMARMDQLQTKLDASNAWEIDRTVERAMDALRCPPGDALVANLSGGERRRVAICRLLLAQPDILLLDEPTNHLDAQSVAWLEQFLATFPGTVVAITHDRYFLDNVAGWILELDRGEGIPFEGNYSSWLDSKSKRLEAEGKKQDSLQRTINQELEWVRSNAKGQQKKGKARLRQYEELCEAANQFTARAELDSITIPAAPRLGSEVITVEGVSKGYEGRGLLIEDFDCIIPAGAVVGIVGANGAGKTTLFKMITGVDTPDKGNVVVGETVKLMYVDQDRESLDGTKTVYETLSNGAEEISLGSRQVNARAYCSWYNFKSGDQQKKVKDLSGGERNRLQLAKTLTSGGNVLMLDEPTNDLDVTTLRALEEAVTCWNGVTMCISHDRWFLNKIATHILAYEGDSKVTFFAGSYDEYEEHRKERMGGAEPAPIKYKPMPV
ncbi:energy-dependent translational throttle protein EttA [bacterium]|jgi:ATP-binding cassette ChvD family protein|nr:energy-dependent translational throttle protein EttA [bacterium]|tara:strand:- start:44 stop:2035 length:1992 start_codon:yes stop_codon:yes gene_type:complete